MAKFTLTLIKKIRELASEHPEYTTSEIAQKLGCSEYQVVSTLHPNY